MKLIKATLCAAVAMGALASASAASAEVTFNAGVATDYVFRGSRQTIDSHEGAAPQVFGGVDWTGGPDLYAGAWVSNTGYSNSNGIEADFYAGWKPKVGPVTLDLGAVYYTFNNSNDGYITSDLNTLEWKAAASLPAGPATLGAAVYYSDNVFSSKESSWYYEVNFTVPVKKDVTLSGAVGQQKSDLFDAWTGNVKDKYTTWNVGLTVPVTEKVSIDARYIGTDKSGTTIWGSYAADDQFVGTLKAVF